MNEKSIDSNNDWNTAGAFLERLNNLINAADQARSEGDLVTWYRRLRTIYSCIHWKIKQEGFEDEEKLLEEQFDKAKSYLSVSSNDRSDKGLISQIHELGLNEVEIILDEVYTKLHDLMYEYEFILPKGKNLHKYATEKFYP